MNWIATLVTTGVLLSTASAHAQIYYGNFTGTDFVFEDVTEDSGTDPLPLFFQPTVVNNTLLFNELNFASSATGGGADDTIGQLTMIIVANPGVGINALQFEEIGSVTLTGLSGEATAAVAALYELDILEVGGVAIDPVSVSLMMPMSPSDGDYSLSADGILTALIWEGSLFVDIGAILAAENILGEATKVALALTNDLTTGSEAGTSAFIGKKQIGGTAVAVVPTCFQVTSEEINCHIDSNTFTYTVQGVDDCSGGVSTYSFTGSGGAVGEQMCFTILVSNGGFCCSTEICVTIPDCSPNCDIDGDGVVGILDLLLTLSAWGFCVDCPADANHDGTVNMTDVLILLEHWG